MYIVWCSKCEFLAVTATDHFARGVAKDHGRKVHNSESGYGIELAEEVERKYNFLQQFGYKVTG